MDVEIECPTKSLDQKYSFVVFRSAKAIFSNCCKQSTPINVSMNVPNDEKVKFSLKAIGGDMASLDRFRWKIAHAIEQCNKAESAQGVEGKRGLGTLQV